MIKYATLSSPTPVVFFNTVNLCTPLHVLLIYLDIYITIILYITVGFG
jgi:hypothetical protein